MSLMKGLFEEDSSKKPIEIPYGLVSKGVALLFLLVLGYLFFLVFFTPRYDPAAEVLEKYRAGGNSSEQDLFSGSEWQYYIVSAGDHSNNSSSSESNSSPQAPGPGSNPNSGATQQPGPSGNPSNPPNDSTPVTPPAVSVARASMGSGTAEVSLIVYLDFQDTSSVTFYRSVLPILESRLVNVGIINITFKQFPSSSHPLAQLQAEAAECANRQGKFFELVSGIVDSGSGADETALKQFAENLGMDTAAFNNCLENHIPSSLVASDVSEAQSLGSSSAPVFVFNGVKQDPALDYPSFRVFVEEARVGGV